MRSFRRAEAEPAGGFAPGEGLEGSFPSSGEAVKLRRLARERGEAGKGQTVRCRTKSIDCIGEASQTAMALANAKVY